MYFAYLAYGTDEIKNQLKTSILSSLLHHQRRVKYLVYSDDPKGLSEFFAPHMDLIDCTPLTSMQLKEWRGPNDFIHNIKLNVIFDALARLQQPMAFVDTDTLIRSSALSTFAQIDDTTAILHTNEGLLSNKRNSLLNFKIYQKLKGKALKHDNMKITAETEMWNTGIVGVDPSFLKFRNLAFDLTAALYNLRPKHVMEQLAISMIAAKNRKILPVSDSVEHYWNRKDFYNQIIADFLDKINSSDAALEQLPKMILDEAISKAEKKQRLAGLNHLFKRLSGRA